MTATTSEDAALGRVLNETLDAQREAQAIDQRPEIAANEIKVEVTMPAGNQVNMTLDASQYDSAITVADAVRDFVLKLLEA